MTLSKVLRIGNKTNILEYLPDFFFWLFLALIVIIRVQIYNKLSIVYIDSDQPHAWLAAKHYSQGIFYEPRYYGQAYNTFMESFFAVPLLWWGLPVYHALPISAEVIFLFPYFFIALYLYFKMHKMNALIVLSFVLCMSTGFDLLTSLPRGFVTGLFFTGFLIPVILYPNKYWLILLGTVSAVVGYFVNPNSVLVCAPALFYIFLHNYKDWKYYLVSLAGVLVWVPMYLIFDRFYKIHPEYIIHALHYDISIDYFLGSFKDLDTRFSHVTPFVENNCLPLLFALVLIAVLVFRWDKKAFFAFVLFIFIILASFWSGKTRDGDNWIYYSYSRFYLGIPIFLCLLISVKIIKPKRKYYLFALIPIAFTLLKLNTLEPTIEHDVKLHSWRAINSIGLQEALNIINYYQELSKKEGYEYIAVSTSHWLNTSICYGGPALYDDFPFVESLVNDRRYWVRERNKSVIYKKFLFLGGIPGLEKKLDQTHKMLVTDANGYGNYKITDNQLKRIELNKVITEIERGN